MPRKFEVPAFYRSPSISSVKLARRNLDPRKKDFSPSILDFGAVKFKIARHFGFCFGVENAIDIAYRAISENKGKRIFLLSEMIHNPSVNADLLSHGAKFLMDTHGNQLIPFSELTKDDIVIVPAFGTTVEIQEQLKARGINPYQHDTTCPFVEKVWKRSEELGNKQFTVVVHGKATHEETRATFSHSKETAPTIIIRDIIDAKFIGDFINQRVSKEDFLERFSNRMSKDFNLDKDLVRIGVVNQTTMLATETQEIAEAIRLALLERYGENEIKNHYADTRDTLCYATSENQNSTLALIESGANLAIVIGGYNSSNTSHLAELCEEQMPTFYIKDAEQLIDKSEIRVFNLHTKKETIHHNWLPEKTPVTIAIASGASCPDKLVDEVINKIVGFFEGSVTFDQALEKFISELAA